MKIKSLFFPLLLVLYEIATYLSNDMYLPALPEMMRDLNLTTKEVQLTLTTWFIGSAALPLVMGIISDRYGRRITLLSGGIVYVISTIACALAMDIHVLLIARFIEGAAIPSMLVAGYACIHELFDQKEAIRILALMSSVTVLAPALGPLLGSILLLFTSWRGIFWFIAFWSALAITLLFKWMPETHPPEKRSPIHWGTLFGQYAKVLTNRRFVLLNTVLGLVFGGFIVWIAAGPLLVIESFEYSPLAFGVIQAIVFAAYITGNRLIKFLLDRAGISYLIWSGLLIALLGGVLLLAAGLLFPQHLYPFLFAMIVYSFGAALCFAPLNRSTIESSDQPMGVRVALFTVIWTGFAVLGSLVAGHYFEGSVISVAVPIAIAAILSCCLNLFVKK